jgi:nucleotide-binding universal stress UspA family protein
MQIHPRKILWPTDLSELSLKGAEYAKAFCDAFKAQLHVIHLAPVLVWADSSVPMMTGGDMLVTSTDTLTPAKAALRALLIKQFGDVSKIKTHVDVGNGWHEICRYAKDKDIDLIVMATHGATGLQHMLIGSTAERVVQHARCPVLAVKSFEREFIDPDTVDREQTKTVPCLKDRKSCKPLTSVS